MLFCLVLGARQILERGGTPLVSFNHVIDPHFVTFSCSLYTTIRNPDPNPNPNPNPSPNPNRIYPTAITDPQIGRDAQIVTVQIRPAPFRAYCRVQLLVDYRHCCTCVKTVDETSTGFGCCGWFLTVVSWFLIGVTFPFSLCVCLRVSRTVPSSSSSSSSGAS